MKDSEKMLEIVKSGLTSSDHKKIYSKHFSETLALECNYCGSLVYTLDYDRHLDECEHLPEDFEYKMIEECVNDFNKLKEELK